MLWCCLLCTQRLRPSAHQNRLTRPWPYRATLAVRHPQTKRARAACSAQRAAQRMSRQPQARARMARPCILNQAGSGVQPELADRACGREPRQPHADIAMAMLRSLNQEEAEMPALHSAPAGARCSESMLTQPWPCGGT